MAKYNFIVITRDEKLYFNKLTNARICAKALNGIVLAVDPDGTFHSLRNF